VGEHRKERYLSSIRKIIISISFKGLSKGTVVFISVDKIDFIYARFSIHRQAVELIEEMPSNEKFISMCSEKIIKVSYFMSIELDMGLQRHKG
jgi:hypothetical protein